MSNDVVKDMINNKQLLNYELVDDLSIGVFMNSYLPKVFDKQKDLKLANCQFLIEYMNFDNLDTSIIFFRNRSSGDRKADIVNMKTTTKILYEKQESFYQKTKYSIIEYIILIFGYSIFLYFLYFIFLKKNKDEKQIINILFLLLIILFCNSMHF
jgi:hypothetical protein